MPVVRIPDDLFERLQRHAVPLVDTTTSVIARILDDYERSVGKSTVKRDSLGSAHSEQARQEPLGPGDRGASDHPTSGTQHEEVPAGVRLRGLRILSQRPMHSARPTMIEIDGEVERVSTWAQLCDVFVKWLLDHQKLPSHRVPIYNAAGRGKYFINTKPEHADSTKKANWRKVGDVFVDTKYNGDAHIRNLISTLENLGLEDLSVKIEIDA